MPESLFTPPVLFILAVTTVVVVPTVAHYWHAARVAGLRAGVERDELALKLEMVKAGMSADDIVRVVNSDAEVPDAVEV